MNFIQRVIFRWRLRRDPHQDLIADYETLVRLARRCAYDFRHAVSYLPQDHWVCTEMQMHLRPAMWVSLFAKGNPGKDYRNQVTMELDRALVDVQTLVKLCEENGIQLPAAMYDRLPF